MTTRRVLLKAVALGGASTLLARAGRGAAAGTRRPAEVPPAPRTLAYRWRDPSAAGALSAQDAVRERAYTSAAYRAPGAFNAVGSRWTGAVARLELRASADGAAWTPWRAVTSHDYDTARPGPSGRSFGDLVTGWGWRFAQYRVAASPGQPPPDVELVLIDTSEGPRVTGRLAPEAETQGATRPAIISRAGWGCDEGLRFDSTGAEIWPPEYRTVQKGLVHHTATNNTYADGAAEVRAIYYYHAVQTGPPAWGDIGYNYLVDRWGNIYEGRYGGENVVGGHALQYNWGSTGIACIGTYGPGGDYAGASPSAAARDALGRILAWTCRSLDPHGSSYFVDATYPNIMGHRDCMQTLCPGDYLYSGLPALRDAVAGLLSAGDTQPAPQITGVAFTPTTLGQGATLKVEVTVRNAGSGPMPTQGPAPGYTYVEGQDFRTLGFAEASGAFRVGVDFDGDALAVDHPYRWGLGAPLAPGQSTTVVGYIQLTSLQQRAYWAGVVEEAIKWWEPKAGATTITVVALPNKAYLPIVTGSGG